MTNAFFDEKLPIVISTALYCTIFLRAVCFLLYSFPNFYQEDFKKMKKIDFVSVLGAAIALAGCASYTPLQSNGATVTNSVEVLGRITVERETDESGYTILLEEALKKYPDADDVANVVVDGKKQFGEKRYVMTALAVKYKN